MSLFLLKSCKYPEGNTAENLGAIALGNGDFSFSLHFLVGTCRNLKRYIHKPFAKICNVRFDVVCLEQNE